MEYHNLARDRQSLFLSYFISIVKPLKLSALNYYLMFHRFNTKTWKHNPNQYMTENCYFATIAKICHDGKLAFRYCDDLIFFDVLKRSIFGGRTIIKNYFLKVVKFIQIY